MCRPSCGKPSREGTGIAAVAVVAAAVAAVKIGPVLARIWHVAIEALTIFTLTCAAAAACDVRHMVPRSPCGLADSLEAFNQVYLDDNHTDEALAMAISEVIRRATSTAIFTLGATYRTWQTADSN